MKKSTSRRALVLSILSLVMCAAMLLGTTYAWFTDTVVSANNIIKSGTLNVELYYQVEGQTDWTKVTDTTNVFKDGALWEPGYTEVVKLKIVNEGNLALKYQLGVNVASETGSVNVYGDDFLLSNYIKYGVVDGAQSYTRDEAIGAVDATATSLNEAFGSDYAALLPTEEAVVTMVVYMPTDVDNVANHDIDADAPVINLGINLFATQYTYEFDSFDDQYDAAAGTPFVGGAGTEQDPYLVKDPAQLMSISDYADEYKYYKIADGVDTVDLTGIGGIVLNGSFDGNGAEFTNLSTALFKVVGKTGVPQDIKISNMDVTTNTTDGSALVKNIYNSGVTTFENVQIHGYIEGRYNMGSFYNYGTANSSLSEGSDYTVKFINAKSDATLVCTTGNAIGGMLGHGFQGSGYTLYIEMDADSGYTGEMYTTGTATCYKVLALCSANTFVLNGETVSRTADTYPSTRLTVSAPTAGADGYYVAPVAGVARYEVFVNSQLTAYDANDVKIANKAGMTWNLGQTTMTADFDGKVLDLVTSVVIVNDVNYALGYEINEGVLTIYSARSDNYASGWVTLQVNQYDANDQLLATGNLVIHTIPEL